LLLLTVALHLWGQFYNFHEIIDDTYISLAYSQNIVNGLGPVANPGEWVEGFSNPVWVLLGCIPLYSGWDPIVFLKILSLFCGVLTVILGYFYAIRVLLLPIQFAFLAVALFSINGGVAFFFTGVLCYCKNECNNQCISKSH
jgi:hypothetical protein